VAGELDAAISEFVSAIDAMDVDRMAAGMTDDAQGVDEISRRWLRGRAALEEYLHGLAAAVTDVRTTVRDVEERVSADTATVTCWIDQDYVFDGAPRHASAPTTMAFRREGGTWKLTLFHSIPIPEH
jgi:ketosteroid isomerase-like protein